MQFVHMHTLKKIKYHMVPSQSQFILFENSTLLKLDDKFYGFSLSLIYGKIALNHLFTEALPKLWL